MARSKVATVADLKALLAGVPDDMLVLTYNDDVSAWRDMAGIVGVHPVTLYEEHEDFTEYTIDREPGAIVLRAFLI